MIRDRYVYVIGSPLGFSKVGWSITPDHRRNRLNTAHPLPLTLYYTWKHAQASKVENRAHHLMEFYRANGEWFRLEPDAAAAFVVMAISDIAAAKPWQRKPRKTFQRQYVNLPRWSTERIKYLTTAWADGISSRLIMDHLNRLSGSKLLITAIAVQVKKLGLTRPDGFRQTQQSNLWSIARDAVLKIRYPVGDMPSDILVELNSLPGDIILWKCVPGRARLLGLSRPPDFKANLTKHLKITQSPRWSPEREAYLAEAWPQGVFPKVILETLLTLPGQSDLNWEVIRDKAKSRGYRRPPGFLRALGLELTSKGTAEVLALHP